MTATPSGLMPFIRAALIEVVRDPSRRPADIDLLTILINDNWASPYHFVDIDGDNKVKQDWRIGARGQAYLTEYPISIDEQMARPLKR